MAVEAGTRRRPGVVTFVGVVLYVKAALAAVGAVIFFVTNGNDTAQADTGLSSAGLVSTGIVEAVMAILLFVVAAGIMRGARSARLFAAVVVAIRMASAVALMLIHHTGGYVFNGLWVMAVGVYVLWALYGNQAADEYFSRIEGEPAR